MADLTEEGIRELVNSLAKPVEFVSALPGGVPCVLAPDGFEVKQLPLDPNLLDGPPRIKTTVKVFDAASFGVYFKRFDNEAVILFADEAKGTVTAIFDYHHEGAAWCQHRLELSLRKSDEWTTWTAQNGKQVSQDAFAQFIEDNNPDISSPSPAQMLEMARTISAKSEINCEGAVRTNGGVTFRYNEMVKGVMGPAGQFEVPDTFTIAIPVYQGGDLVSLLARLRYRVAGGKLTMWYELYRASQAETGAFRAVREDISVLTEKPVVNGSAQ